LRAPAVLPGNDFKINGPQINGPNGPNGPQNGADSVDMWPSLLVRTQLVKQLESCVGKPNRVAPNNMAPNNMAPNNSVPNNVAPNNSVPNNVVPNTSVPNSVAPNNSVPNSVPNNSAPNNIVPNNVAPAAYSARAFADPAHTDGVTVVIVFAHDPQDVCTEAVAARRAIHALLMDLNHRQIPFQILRHFLGARMMVVHMPPCAPFAFLCFVNTAMAIIQQGAMTA
jgi:hypothetical protein